MANKYSELSDFEVDVEVTKKLGLIEHMHISHATDHLLENEGVFWNIKSNLYYNGFGSKKGCRFSACNNREIAFKLMIDNKIELGFDQIMDKWVAIVYDNDVPMACNENPCRAIAECFLLMKDAENNNG